MKRSMMIPGFWILLFGLMWLLVACRPIPLNEPTATTKSALTSSGACAETVLQSDLAYVSQKPELANYLVYWTWHMNFLAFSDPVTKSHPLGCFRLYAREHPSDKFQAIDNGGIDIDCEAIDDVAFDTVERPYAIRGNVIISSPVAPTGQATFTNGGYIRCNNFSIRTIAQRIEQTGVPPNLLSGLSQLTGESTQIYDTLTLVATGYVTDVVSSNPVLHYQPTGAEVQVRIAAGDITDPTITFSLPIDPPIVTFLTLLEAKQYTPISSSCDFNSQDKHFWWIDFTGFEALPRLSFLRHTSGNLFTPDLVECLGIDSSSSENRQPPLEITFWTGDSAICIGCELNFAGECDSNQAGQCVPTFNGVLYNVLIDPLNSKPQSLHLQDP